jgi:hypothetical protein
MNTLRPIESHRHLLNRWSCRATRREDLAAAKTIAALLVAYMIVGYIDAQADEVSQAMAGEAAAYGAAATATRHADLHAARLARCLNGGPVGLYSTDKEGYRNYVVCDKAWEITNKGIKTNPPRGAAR